VAVRTVHAMQRRICVRGGRRAEALQRTPLVCVRAERLQRPPQTSLSVRPLTPTGRENRARRRRAHLCCVQLRRLSRGVLEHGGIVVLNGLYASNILRALRTRTRILHRQMAYTGSVALSVAHRALSVTQRALSVTQRALSVTPRARNVTQRALSVTQRAHQRHPERNRQPGTSPHRRSSCPPQAVGEDAPSGVREGWRWLPALSSSWVGCVQEGRRAGGERVSRRATESGSSSCGSTRSKQVWYRAGSGCT
jgi:hypothetical protein